LILFVFYERYGRKNKYGKHQKHQFIGNQLFHEIMEYNW